MYSAVFVFFVFFQLVIGQEYYSVPDNIDVDQIIENDRLLRNYVDCLLDKGKCTPEGKELRKILPEALGDDCAKCNEKHREGARKVLHHLIEKKSDWWKELEAKYDPSGDYKKKYKNYIEKEGLAI